MVTEIQLAAPAKINLALDITGTRADGYHLLAMVMQSVSLADTVTIRRIPGEAVLKASIQGIPLDGKNIALRAWYLMKTRFQLPGGVEIFLQKKIPVAGGMAGGSSDAAAVLRGVNQLFNLALSASTLREISLPLGADLPYCIAGGTVLAEGIGEILTPMPALPKIWMVLVNPGFGVSTVAVYRHFDQIRSSGHPDIPAMARAISLGDLSAVKDHLGNVLEQAAFEMHPQLAGIKEELAALGLRPLMSGSGPTFFALAADEAAARQAAAQIAERWPFVTVVSTI